MKQSDYILMVGGREASVVPTLEAEIPVRHCPGPGGDTDCPAMRHEPCPLRSEAWASVVYLAGEHEFHAPGRWDCVAASAAPVVAVIGGSTRPPNGENGFGVVGSKWGPLGVLRALASVVGKPDRPE